VKGKTIAERAAPMLEKRWKDFEKQFKNADEMKTKMGEAQISANDVKQELKIQIYREMLLADKIQVSKKEVKDFYDKNKENLATPERIRLGRIVVATESEAKDVQLSLSVGADFGALAKAKSIDPATRDRGGELGVFSPGMLAPNIEKQLFALDKGKTAILQDGQSYQVLEVLDKSKAEPAVWNKAMQDKIQDALEKQKLSSEYPKWLEKAQTASQIKINIPLGQ
jgi:foldase protein PrsA